MSENRAGAIRGFSAYLIWGCFPLYFKMVAEVSAREVLAHRILWSAVFLLLLVTLTGRGKNLRKVLSSPGTVAVLLATTLLLATNWYVFINAVFKGYVLEASLGYFINPLVSVLLGFVFLREKLSTRQVVSIALAAAGVLVRTVMVGKVPLVALTLAFTFGLYGLVRKAVGVQAVPGLTVEMILLSPFALGYLGWLMAGGNAVFLAGRPGLDVLLVLAGVVTSVPLVLYGGALTRLRLSTMGIMQYIVPTGHFTLAVLAFGEPFTAAHLVSFAFIWAALALYTSGSLGELRPTTQAAGQS
ncbi:MAG: EamA family transporter RarD [bacterium]|nr:EamA family transporter RarD [bacterium]